ncbi:MAG: hypothetical protein V1758_15600 [Pseudomonadota bacterium]
MEVFGVVLEKVKDEGFGYYVSPYVELKHGPDGVRDGRFHICRFYPLGRTKKESGVVKSFEEVAVIGNAGDWQLGFLYFALTVKQAADGRYVKAAKGESGVLGLGRARMRNVKAEPAAAAGLTQGVGQVGKVA